MESHYQFKISDIIILISLIVVVKGTWWAAAAQPVILGLGAAFAAIDLDLTSYLIDFDIEKPSWREILRKKRESGKTSGFADLL